MEKVYLRELIFKTGNSFEQKLSIFEGDVKKDRLFWFKDKNCKSIRYIELKEWKE